MTSKFNRSKNIETFEKRYGKGSYDSGLARAREIGTTRARADFEKAAYNQRVKAFEAEMKEQKKARKKDAEKIAVKKKEEDEINAILNQANKGSNGENKNSFEPKKVLKPLKDFLTDTITAPTKEDKAKSKKAGERFLNNREGSGFGILGTGSLAKKKETKDKGNLLKDLLGVSAGAVKSINPFDDELFGDAILKNAMKFDEKKSKQFDEVARSTGRTTNTASFGLMGNLDKKMRDGETPHYLTKRKIGEGGGADILSDLLGYAVPGAALTNGLRGTKLGADLGKKALSKGGAITRAKEGAAVGAIMSGTEIAGREALNPDDSNWKQNLAQIGIETAGGAILDPLLSAGGPLVNVGGKKLLNQINKGKESIPKVFDNLPTVSKKKELNPNILGDLTPLSKSQKSKPVLEDLLPKVDQVAATTTKPKYDVDMLMKSYKGQDVVPSKKFDPSILIKPIEDTASIAPKKLTDLLPDTQVKPIGDINSFRGKVNRKPVKDNNGLFSNLRTQFVDDVASLETLEKKIVGEISSAENSVYKQARLFKGSPEKAHLIVKEQLYPVLKELQDNGMNYKDLGDYSLAIHARDVNSQGINSGFTNSEIDDVISKLGSEQMESARLKLLGVNNNVLNMLQEGNIIDSGQVAAMREKYPNYVSLFRSFDDDKVDFANGLGKALANASSPIKKLEGSNRDVIDPVESVIKNIFKATNAVDRNKVGTQIANLAKKDTEGAFIRQLSDGEDVGRLNVISVLDQGKQTKYEVPPEVYRTLTNMDKESSNTLIKILQKPASLLRAGATLTPEFSLRNPLRDVPNAFVVSKSGFNPVVDFPIGLWQSIWKGRTIKIGGKEFKTSGELYKQFVKENGGYGNIISMDRKLHQETLKKALTDVNTNYVDVLNPKTYQALIKKFGNPINTLRTIADVSETATKVGEFRAAIRSGASPQEAAYQARDIMDFGRAGISIREANKVVAFLNANIQGKSKLWRAFKENPVKVTGKAVAAVTIPTIGAIVAQNTFANDKQKEIINDAPRWMKDTFWLMPIPGSNQIARIPKPFDLAFAYSNTIERAVEYIYKNDKEAFDGWIKQGFSQASVPVMLTGLTPIVEGMADYSFFRQGPIIPLREKGLQYPDQYDVNTTETAKFIGKQVNSVTGGVGAFKNFGSPRVVDNTIRGFTGGLGTYATSVIDVFARGDEGDPARPAKSIDQQPLTRAFLVNQSSSGDSLDKLYNLKDKLTKARGSAKQNKELFVDEAKYKMVNDATKTIGELNKKIRSVENHVELSAEDKKIVLDVLIERRNTLSREAMEKIKNME